MARSRNTVDNSKLNVHDKTQLPRPKPIKVRKGAPDKGDHLD